jgi:hypothetical protein
LTVPWLPTGRNTGVGIAPWGVVSSPALALLWGQVFIR